MIELRNQTVENIINASDATLVCQIIDESIKTLKNNNTHDFIVVRFLSKLEMTIKEIYSAIDNNDKCENLKKALQYINKHELNKIKFDAN